MNDLLVSFYGDDFTGSTDVMESLTFAGLRTVLYLEAPGLEEVKTIPGVRAIGVAGRARSLSPSEAEAELMPVFKTFSELSPELIHYKTCSTFDSSPKIGSIGRAIDVGCEVFRPEYVPLIVGAPSLRRYCAFGNLFASSGLDSEVFRLDRHPTMRVHPTTPMDEADVRRHLEKQTDRLIGLVNVTQLGEADDRINVLLDCGRQVVLFDTVTGEDLEHIGRAIWENRERGRYVVGSSGAEYALVAHWRLTNEIAQTELPSILPVDQIAVASGSCSPVTAGQIDWALANGFELVALDTKKLVSSAPGTEIARGIAAACEILSLGRSVIVHTGRGPGDPRIEETLKVLGDQGFAEGEARSKTAQLIGGALGDVLREVVERTHMTRVATTGGDTSYYVAKQMGVTALEAIGPMAPGSPLCRVYSDLDKVNGCEMTFKGGQVGKVDFFGQVLAGN